MDSSQNNVVDIAFELSRLLRQELAPLGARHEINMLRFHALTLLRDRPELTMTELAGLLNISASTATAFIDRLVRRGFVSRRPDARNRKFIRLRLTTRGAAVLRAYETARKRILKNAIDRVPPDDQAHLQRIFHCLIDHLHPSASRSSTHA